MASAHVNHQNKQDSLQAMISQSESTNGTVLHKVEVSNSHRKDRRKDWWDKYQKKSNPESSNESKAREQTADTHIYLKAGVVGDTDPESDKAERPKLRNRKTIAKPDSLKYEPDFNKGFHNKIMQNLYTDTSKKKKNKPIKELGESLSKPNKRKPIPPSAANEPENAKRIKEGGKNEAFDSYKFSLNLINGEVDVAKHSSSKDSKNKYVLFIGNLPYDITREQLEEHFRKTGGIKSIRIPKEKGTDKGRGFAYMEFDGRISHGIALRLHHTTLGGRTINVEFTSIGGGKSEARKEKLKLKNRKRKNMKMQ